MLFVRIGIAFLWTHILFVYFRSYIFASCKEIDKKFFETSKHDGKASRQRYEEKLYHFQNTEAGKDFLDSLSFLEGIRDKFKKRLGAEKEVIQEEKKSLAKELQQYEKYKKEHPKMIPLIGQVQNAVKEVFGDSSLALEMNRKKNKLKNIIKKIKNKLGRIFRGKKKQRSFLQTKVEGKENDEKKIEDAVTLSNILNVMSNIEQTLPKSEVDKIYSDKNLLAKKLIRPDITMNAEEFENLYLGEKEEGKSATKKQVRELEKKLAAASFLQNFDGKTEGGARSNRCSTKDEICDRRMYSDSCESRIEVEDQGPYGSCWAFAGAQHLEIHHCIFSGKDTIYSKQEIVDCTATEEGGNFKKLMSTLKNRNRLSDARSYPYEVSKKTCQTDKPDVWTGDLSQDDVDFTFFKKKDLEFSTAKWIHFMKNYIKIYGSINTSILMDNSFRFNSGGIVRMCTPHKTNTNHAVLITGWTVKDGEPVWIVRNSWGTWYGDNGYVYVAMNNKECKKNFGPMAKFYYVPTIVWSDAISNYKVIETNTQQEKDVLVKVGKINRGDNAIVHCPMSKIIQLRKVYVVKHHEKVPEETFCNSLHVEQTCENKTACHVVFPSHMCPPGFDALVIKYKCIPMPVDYDCSYAQTLSSDVSGDECRDFCNQAASNCDLVTKDCLYEQVDSTLCDFTDVITEASETD